MAILGNTTATQLTVANDIIADKIIKSGGTKHQFLKADGSIDSNTYLTSIAGETADKTKGALKLKDTSGTEKSFNGSGDVDLTGGVNYAAKAGALNNPVTVAGGTLDTVTISNFGGENPTVSTNIYGCMVASANIQTYPYHRFAQCDSSVDNGYYDAVIVLSKYGTTGYYGIAKLAFTKTTDGGSASITWLVRSGFPVDYLRCGLTKTVGSAKCGFFVFDDSNWVYTNIRVLTAHENAGYCNDVISFEDAKARSSTEHANCYTSITEAGYATTVNATENGTVKTISTTLPVTNGGTGCTTLTSGGVLIGNGGGSVTTRAITNNNSKSHCNWTSSTGTNLITLNTLAYWDGRFNKDASNLEYCKKGAFSELAVKALNNSTTQFLNGAGNWATPPNTWRDIIIGETSIGNNKLTLKGGTGITLSNNNGTVTINGERSEGTLGNYSISLSKSSWTTFSQNLPSNGTYAIQIKDGDTNYYSGVCMLYESSSIQEEIPLHASKTTNDAVSPKRIFAATRGRSILLSSLDEDSVDHTITIKYLKLISL